MYARALSAALLVATCIPAIAQTQQASPDPASAPCGDVKTAQPKIMVIPRVKEGEDIRTVIDSDINIRVAIAKVQEAFNQRGFTTVDFVAKLKAAQEANIFNSENVSDFKTQLLSFSGADIYTEVEYDWKPGSPNSCTMILTGYDVTTGNNLGAQPGTLQNASSDISLFVQGIINQKADAFLNDMQSKFTEMINDGRPVNLTFTFAQGSMFNAESEIAAKDNNDLASVLEEWMGRTAVKGNYSSPMTTTNGIFYDDVRIPLRHAITCKNYTPTMFSKEVQDFLKELGIQSSKTVNRARVMITIK